MAELTQGSIDPNVLLTQACSPAAGGVVLFLGTTREYTQGRRTLTLDYTAYELMAMRQMTQLEEEASRRWGLSYCRIVHRLGNVPLGETSVAVVAASPHRAAAFEAAQWLIDTLKRDIPIWKREHWADGTDAWIHPIEAEQDGPG